MLPTTLCSGDGGDLGAVPRSQLEVGEHQASRATPKLLAHDGSAVGGVAWFAARGAGARPEVRVDRLVMHAAIQLGHHGGDFAEQGTYTW